MPGEKTEFRPEEPVVRRTKSGAAHVSRSGTPKLPTDLPESALHTESHRESEAKEANGLDQEEVEELEHNPSAHLPNWFRTG